MITGDCAAMETWSLLKKKKKKKKKAKEENMNYKGYKELIPESHWIKVEGTDLFKCSECGHLQDIFKKGTACEECGTWMVARLVKDEKKRPTEEMVKFRAMLDEDGISWEDASDRPEESFWVDRTHFKYRGFLWSVIHGYGTYGGYNFLDKDEGKLELMSNAVNCGEPVGHLTAEECMALVTGEEKKEEEKDGN